MGFERTWSIHQVISAHTQKLEVVQVCGFVLEIPDRKCFEVVSCWLCESEELIVGKVDEAIDRSLIGPADLVEIFDAETIHLIPASVTTQRLASRSPDSTSAHSCLGILRPAAASLRLLSCSSHLPGVDPG